MELKGKTAVVTGAGRGIGFGIASVMAREGANVVISDINLETAEDAVRQIEAQGGRAAAIKADVSRADDNAAMVQLAKQRLGGLDILVNNAGIEAPPRELKDIPEAQWDRVTGINLRGVYLCCKAAIPALIERGGGSIVNIASLAGQRMTFFGSADYTAAKHGVVGLTYHLAWELAEHHITVNAICPGAVLTPLAEQNATPEFRAMVTKRLIPLGRWCTPDDIGETASFLASPRAGLITGQAISVDGGLMTGYGEDLRPVLKQRMAAMQASHTTGHE
jgi:NAD(P)-dependent dehydrogenase (short-subunit alcohol dehydrogenase family)